MEEKLNEWVPGLDEYNPGITKEQWVELVQDKNIFTEDALITFACIQKANVATCFDMAAEFGRTSNYYSANNWRTGERVYKKTGCPLSKRDEGRERFWSVCCLGRRNQNHWEFRIRPELQAAFEETGVLVGIEVMEKKEFRLIHWNISYSSKRKLVLDFIKSNIKGNTIINLNEVLEPTYLFLKENLKGCKFEYSLNYRQAGKYEGKNRKLGVLTIIAGYGGFLGAGLLNNTVFPERTLFTNVSFKDFEIKNLNFHSITGCSYKDAKTSNFASIASFLADNSVDIMTFDANEPKIDSFNEREVVCFDDGKDAALLIGDKKMHEMQDCFKETVKMGKLNFDDGYTHIIKRAENKKRYDYIFADKKYEVKSFKVLYEEAINNSSDHAMLVCDLLVK